MLECYVYLNNLAVGRNGKSELDVYVKLIEFLNDEWIVFNFVFKTCIVNTLLKLLKEMQKCNSSSQTTKPTVEKSEQKLIALQNQQKLLLKSIMSTICFTKTVKNSHETFENK